MSLGTARMPQRLARSSSDPPAPPARPSLDAFGGCSRGRRPPPLAGHRGDGQGRAPPRLRDPRREDGGGEGLRRAEVAGGQDRRDLGEDHRRPRPEGP
eukprot:14501598-Alexandrium_andersonii.AAC.1